MRTLLNTESELRQSSVIASNPRQKQYTAKELRVVSSSTKRNAIVVSSWLFPHLVVCISFMVWNLFWIRRYLVAVVVMSSSSSSSSSLFSLWFQEKNGRQQPGWVVSAIVLEGHSKCRPITVQHPFDLEMYISAPWYAQQQAETRFQSREYMYCVRATYSAVPPLTVAVNQNNKNHSGMEEDGTKNPPAPLVVVEGGRSGGKTNLGYTLLFNNEAQDVQGIRSDGGMGLCAYQTNPIEEPAKLAVSACNLPKLYARPYWVLAYQEGPHGYALVSAGPPIIQQDEDDGSLTASTNMDNLGTTTGSSRSDSGSSTSPYSKKKKKKTRNAGCRTKDSGGLWILTRTPKRNETVVRVVREIAHSKGFDLSVLFNVTQDGCVYDDNNRHNLRHRRL